MKDSQYQPLPRKTSGIRERQTSSQNMWLWFKWDGCYVIPLQEAFRNCQSHLSSYLPSPSSSQRWQHSFSRQRSLKTSKHQSYSAFDWEIEDGMVGSAVRLFFTSEGLEKRLLARIPNDYSPPPPNGKEATFILIISVAHAGIHCAGWHFNFIRRLSKFYSASAVSPFSWSWQLAVLYRCSRHSPGSTLVSTYSGYGYETHERSRG